MLRVAQIGVGGWGKNHARVLAEMGVLVAVCDMDEDRARTCSREYDTEYHTDVDSLIRDADFDAAIVATPTITHADVARTLIRAKKHVLVEKPITYSPAEGRRLEEMASKAGVVLTCGYIERFNPAVQCVRGIVSDEKYGQPVLLEFHRENRVPLHIKDVGIIYDTAVHDIDTANWLFDAMPQVVFARKGTIHHTHEDFATIMLGYGQDRTATIACNWLSPDRVRMFRVALADGTITGDFITQEVRMGKEMLKIQTGEPLRLEMESFVEAASGRAPVVVTPHQAVCVSQIAQAALLSSQRGVPIYLELK